MTTAFQCHRGALQCSSEQLVEWEQMSWFPSRQNFLQVIKWLLGGWQEEKQTEVVTGISDVRKVHICYCKEPITGFLRLVRIVYRTATVWQNQRFLPSENIHAASDSLLCAPDIHSLKTRGEWVPTRHREGCTLCSKKAESPQPCQMGGHHQLQGKAPTTGHRVAAQPTEPSLSLCSSICLHFRLLFGKFFIQFASLTARILSSLWL